MNEFFLKKRKEKETKSKKKKKKKKGLLQKSNLLIFGKWIAND